MKNILSTSIALGVVCLLLSSTLASATPVYSVQELFPLPGDYKVQANSLNASGQVVGYSRNVNGTASAVLWQNGTVRNLSGSDSGPTVSYVALDINDVGKIIGSSSKCDGACTDPILGAPGFPFFPLPFASDGWITSTDPAFPDLLPFNFGCAEDEFPRLISDAGYVANTFAIRSPHGGGPVCISVRDLYENGIAITPLGFLFDAIAANDLGGFSRQWIVAPTCDGDAPAYRINQITLEPGLPVSNDVKATICDLVATGYSRDRQQNALGQIISNVGDRALLFTPVSVSEPGTLLLFSLALAGLGWSRRALLVARTLPYRHCPMPLAANSSRSMSP